VTARTDGVKAVPRGARASAGAPPSVATPSTAAIDALLVDAGATRVRVAALRGRSQFSLDAPPAGDWSGLLPAGIVPPRVLVGAACGVDARARLASTVRDAWRVDAEFVGARTEAARLYCAEPHAVGVDRWLAMIGASQRADRHAYAVVTCGPVLAVDLVDGGGRHRGSYVVPGVRPMREALFARTGSLASLAALAAPATDGLFGVNTAGGIEQGARVALASLAERALLEIGALARGGAIAFVCGEDAGQLRPYLSAEFVDAPDLVLDGLAVLALERPA
jgi:type III pantothenate kinase